jgi:hypothetical protein
VFRSGLSQGLNFGLSEALDLGLIEGLNWGLIKELYLARARGLGIGVLLAASACVGEGAKERRIVFRLPPLFLPWALTFFVFNGITALHDELVPCNAGSLIGPGC